MAKQFCPKGHNTFLVGRTKRSTCNECQKNATTVWSKKDPVRQATYYKSWYKENYEQARIPKRNYSWKRRGIVNVDGTNFRVEDYERILLMQLGKCKICRQDRPKDVKEFAVDHDHSSGKVRGLLCQGCNTKVGVVEGKQLQDILNYLNGKL